MIRVYDMDGNIVGVIVNYKDAKIESTLSNGDKTFSFSYIPTKDVRVQHEGYVRTDKDEYVVKEVVPGAIYTNVCAKLNLEGLEGVSWTYREISRGSIVSIMSEGGYNILDKTGWVCNYDGCSEDTLAKQRSFRLSKENVFNAFEKICDAFTCEMKFDTFNKVVYLADRIGSDRGVHFIKGFNLNEISVQANTYDFCTRLIPLGAADANGECLTIGSVNDDKDYIDNFQYSNKIKLLIWEDSNYTDAQALKDDAIYKLQELSKPKKSYSVKIHDLANMSREYEAFSYELGDTVTIIVGDLEIREKQRIIKMVEYPNNPRKNTCELANTVLSFEDMQKRMMAAAAATESVTNGNIVIGSKVEGMSAIQIDGLENYIKKDDEVDSLTVKDLNAPQLKSEKIFLANDDIDTRFERAGRFFAGSVEVELAEAEEMFERIETETEGRAIFVNVVGTNVVEAYVSGVDETGFDIMFKNLSQEAIICKAAWMAVKEEA